VSVVWRKWFTLLKSVKHFWSNRNYFTVNCYFRPHQTSKNTEIIF